MDVLLRATYESIEWDDRYDDPQETRGYTNPRNPWYGFKDEVPEGLVGPAFTAWRDKNAETLTLTLWEAAEFVANFPGGVWDYTEGESELQADGTWLSVTLH